MSLPADLRWVSSRDFSVIQKKKFSQFIIMGPEEGHEGYQRAGTPLL